MEAERTPALEIKYTKDIESKEEHKYWKYSSRDAVLVRWSRVL